ncbi:MAG TPA: LysR substrate-binding domain-containing protein [Chthoniobacterales bacterium]|nr:LysR substrate-binding domain-containing protein [Chthoniobacterales bacterium]
MQGTSRGEEVIHRVPPILLQTFLVVAEVGQISEAARRLHLSQPTVTGQIRRLEANLETTLFIRSARGVSLTPMGAHLRERLQDVFAELEQILQELDRTREVTETVTLAASTTLARYFVPRIFIRFHHYHPASALHLIVGNTEEVLDHLRQHRVGLGLVEGHQRSPGVRLEPFIPDEIIPVSAARITDPKLRRRIEGVKSARDLEAMPLIWRESGAGTRSVVESALKDGGVNPRKLDQRYELGSSEAIKSLVIAGLGIGFFSSWEIQQEMAMGLVRQISVPGLRIQRTFSWALPSGELGGALGEFYRFANSIRGELSTVSVRTWKNEV